MEEGKSQYTEKDMDPATSCFAQQLDDLISKMYAFVDIPEENLTKTSIIEPKCTVDPTLSFYFLSTGAQNTVTKHKRKIWKPKPKFFEKITYEDMCSVVVTGEWVLNKKGIYGRGRERRSELITGACHSPKLQHCK